MARVDAGIIHVGTGHCLAQGRSFTPEASSTNSASLQLPESLVSFCFIDETLFDLPELR